MPPVIAAWPDTSGLVRVLTKFQAASWFLTDFRDGNLPTTERHERTEYDGRELVPCLGLRIPDLVEPGSIAEPTLPDIFDCLGSAAMTPVSPQPIDSATWPPATAAFTSPNEKFSALGRAELRGPDVFLQTPSPSRDC